MVEQPEAATRRTLPGRLIVLAIVLLGAGMGLAGFLLRERRGPSLPLKPGAIVVVTCETMARPVGSREGEPADPNRTTFDAAVAPSSELFANLGALWTGKMPRVNGLVRRGDALRSDVPTLAGIAAGQGFATAAFLSIDVGELVQSELIRGFKEFFASSPTPDAELAQRAGQWLVGRGREPSLAWLHLKSDEALPRFQAELAAQGVLDHAAVVVARPLASSTAEGVHALPRGGHVGLSLRLPVPLLPLSVDPDPVSLIDVAASLCEAFGIRAPDGIGTPWLLHPAARAPNVVLSTRPLAGAFADADEVWLVSSRVTYINAPARRDDFEKITAGPFFGHTNDGTRLFNVDGDEIVSARKLVEQRFAYRFEEADLAAVMESVVEPGAPTPAPNPRADAPARVFVARSTLRPAPK